MISQVLLELWSTADDDIRMVSFLALRRLAVASDDATKESVMKVRQKPLASFVKSDSWCDIRTYQGVYTNLIRSAKHTTTYTLPAINLMKNSAAELYLLNQEAAYAIVFGYIRQLAIHLRNSMKLKTKVSHLSESHDRRISLIYRDFQEGFQAVYNWQFFHSMDFWSLVLSTACDANSQTETTSPLQPLIYPLVQIATGVMK